MQKDVTVNTIQTKRILLIDDDPDTLKLIPQLFLDKGIVVDTATTATKGLQKIYQIHPSVVLLAPSFLGMGSWQMLTDLRGRTNAPIIVLIPFNQIQDITRYFANGATDYLIKPFVPKLLAERVMTALEYAPQDLSPPPKQVMIEERLVIEPTSRRVLLDYTEVNLTTLERRLFFYLFAHANEVCTFEEILSNVWGPEYRESTQYVHVYISRLRKKLEQDFKHPRYLLTEHGIGYWFRHA